MQILSKFIKFGTGATEVNSRVLPANFTPTYYTPTAVGAEATTMTSAHLKGIDVKLGTIGGSANDIAETSATLIDNTLTVTNITGFSFPNASVRAFDSLISITRASTYVVLKLTGIQKGSSWEMTQSGTGDETGITLSISTSGNIQYISTSTGNNATIKFRAITVGI